jgi:hypothetical protein
MLCRIENKHAAFRNEDTRQGTLEQDDYLLAEISGPSIVYG